MLWKKFIFYLLLCFITIKFEVFAVNFQRFEYDVSNHVEVSVKNENLNEVKFNKVSCTIHYYNLMIKLGPDGTRSKSMQFYFCINCMFADWIRNELFKIIEHVPLLYSSKLMSSNNDEFRNTISVLTLVSIENNNERFIDILFNIVNMYTYAAHIDTDLLKSLLILHFKINFITKLYESNNDVGTSSSEIIGKDEVIIPLILDSINDLQRFSAMNCDVSSSYHNNNKFYGYSMNKQDSNGIDIDKFFVDIKPMGQESHDRCTVDQILLRHVLDSEDPVAREISKIRIYVDQGRVILKKILNEIGNSFNLELMLWYLRLVHESIVKILCTKVLDVLKSRKELNVNTVGALRVIRFLFSEFMHLPQPLVDVFRLLTSEKEEEKEKKPILIKSKYANIKDYVDRRNAPRSDGDDDVYDAFRLPFFHVEVIADESSPTLDDLLLAIMNKIVDYRCMANAMRFLNVEKGKYYLPHVQRSFTVYEFLKKQITKIRHYPQKVAQDGDRWHTEDEPSKFRWDMESTAVSSWHAAGQWWPGTKVRSQIADDSPLVEKTCDYLTAVYQHCVDAFMVAADAQCNRSVSCVAELRGHVSAVALHLKLNLFDTARRSATLSQIAFDVMPMERIVANHEASILPSISVRETELVAYLHVIMTALNGYAIKRCRPPAYNYLLFNNVNFDAATAATVSHDCDHQRKRFLDAMGTPPVDGYQLKDPLRLTALIGLFVIYEVEYNRQVLAVADRRPALFYWRGEPMTFAEIYVNVRSTVMSPAYMYEFNDVYYKHVFATVVRETYAYICRLNTAMAVTSTPVFCVKHVQTYSSLVTNDLLSADDFPKPFKYVVQLFNNFVKTFFNQITVLVHFLIPGTMERQLQNEIARLGVIVNVEKPQKITSVPNETKEPINYDEQSARVIEFQDKIREIIKSTQNVKVEFINRFLDKYK